MALRLGIDFGTATTCVATVPNPADLAPEVIAIDGRPSFVESLVWVTHPLGKPIVPSKHTSGRCPTAVFSPAQQEFWKYWKTRVATQSDGIKWEAWLQDGNEQAMLLSYFKPELADNPVPHRHSFANVVHSAYDPLTQSTDLYIDYATRVIADPAPDTEDLVAATAAIIRRVAEAARRKFNAQVERLVIGVPSYRLTGDPTEAKRAEARRLEAVELSGVGNDFGTPDFRAETFGEAQAAGFGLDMDSTASEVFVLIVDCGAGTTDMALLPYRRTKGRRLLAADPLSQDSFRFAGRNLNEAIAKGLRQNRDVRKAYEAMDERAWQILMDNDIERIKRELCHEEKEFPIRFRRYADAVDTGLWENAQRDAIWKVVRPLLSLESPEIRDEVQKACRHWIREVAMFLRRAKDALGSKEPVAIEMIGGAFKFEPLRSALRAAATQAGIGNLEIRYRADGDESQTAVARGLARHAALIR